MAWQDRLTPATATAPSGRQFSFVYEVLISSVSKRTTAFSFPNLPGTFVQDLGPDGRRYPWRIFFWGADYDTEASAFMDAVEEQGTWVLSHPQYGEIDAIPFGDISRRDDLVNEAGQAVIDCTFFATIDINAPGSVQNASSSIQNAVGVLDSAVEGETSGIWGSLNAVERSLLSARSSELFRDVNATLGQVSQISSDVSQRFNAVYDATIGSVLTLTETPLNLIARTKQLIQLPARAQAELSERINLYDNLLGRVTSRSFSPPLTQNDRTSANALANDVMFAYNAIGATALCIANTPSRSIPATLAPAQQVSPPSAVVPIPTTQQTTAGVNELANRTQAIEAIDSLLDQFDAVTVWRETQQATINQEDTGEAYQALQALVAETAGVLLRRSFQLPVQRSVVLSVDRNFIELVAELYGTVNNRALDDFINNNDLGGDEFEELKAGRRVVYYR